MKRWGRRWCRRRRGGAAVGRRSPGRAPPVAVRWAASHLSQFVRPRLACRSSSHRASPAAARSGPRHSGVHPQTEHCAAARSLIPPQSGQLFFSWSRSQAVTSRPRAATNWSIASSPNSGADGIRGMVRRGITINPRTAANGAVAGERTRRRGVDCRRDESHGAERPSLTLCPHRTGSGTSAPRARAPRRRARGCPSPSPSLGST